MDDDGLASDPRVHPGRGGRPRKGSDGLCEIIPARFTADEAARIRAAAAGAGVSASAIVRAAFNNANLTLTVTEAAPPEIVRQLRIMGHNLDQALFEARRGNFTPAAEHELRAAAAAISAQLRGLLHGPEC